MDYSHVGGLQLSGLQGLVNEQKNQQLMALEHKIARQRGE